MAEKWREAFERELRARSELARKVAHLERENERLRAKLAANGQEEAAKC